MTRQYRPGHGKSTPALVVTTRPRGAPPSLAERLHALADGAELLVDEQNQPLGWLLCFQPWTRARERQVVRKIPAEIRDTPTLKTCIHCLLRGQRRRAVAVYCAAGFEGGAFVGGLCWPHADQRGALAQELVDALVRRER